MADITSSIRNLSWLNGWNSRLYEVVQDLISGINNNAGTNQSIVENEVPSGPINGVNASFTLKKVPNPPSSARLFKNGQRLGYGIGFTVSGNKIIYAPAYIPSGTDSHLIDYRC